MRSTRLGIAVAALLLGMSTPGCQPVGAPSRVDAPADAEAGEIAFEMAGPGGAALVVPVHINGEGPYDFVLDTGATLTCVDQALVARLGLPERRMPGVGVGVGGTGRVQLVGVDSIAVGAARAHDLAVCALDLEHTQAIGLAVDGLLGLNFLRNFHLTLDFERNILVLQEPLAP
jgi:predicted aspartyl protease